MCITQYNFISNCIKRNIWKLNDRQKFTQSQKLYCVPLLYEYIHLFLHDFFILNFCQHCFTIFWSHNKVNKPYVLSKIYLKLFFYSY